MLLSIIFLKNPDLGLLEKLENLKNFKKFSNILKPFFKSMRKLPRETLLEKIQIDFVKVVRAMRKEDGIIPPYESLWRGEERVMGNCSEEVLEFYKKSNINFDFNGEAPDHLGVEFKFMSLLCYMERKKLKEKDCESVIKIKDMERMFYKKHLIKWAPLYLQKVEKEAETDFYKCFSILANAFLRNEKIYFKDENN